MGYGVMTYINRQVFPQAPSPTMTSLRRISAMLAAVDVVRFDKGETETGTARKGSEAMRWTGDGCWNVHALMACAVMERQREEDGLGKE